MMPSPTSSSAARVHAMQLRPSTMQTRVDPTVKLAEFIREVKAVWTPTTIGHVSTLIDLLTHARDVLDVFWLTIAIAYRVLQVSLSVVINTCVREASRVAFAKVMIQTATNNFSRIEQTYTNANAEISAIKGPMRQYVMSVLPSLAEFNNQRNVCIRDATEYIASCAQV